MSVDHWAGTEGYEYIKRQTLTQESRDLMFMSISDFLESKLESVIEFGASTGENLMSLRRIGRHGPVVTAAVEINKEAIAQIRDVDEIFEDTIQNFRRDRQWHMTFTRGVLIHIPPDDLPKAYDTLYRHSRQYIMIAEYYSPTPVMIEYRGKPDLLWKRDFAGEMMDRYPDLKLIGYNFIYHRDPVAPQDDVTVFIMEKT